VHYTHIKVFIGLYHLGILYLSYNSSKFSKNVPVFEDQKMVTLVYRSCFYYLYQIHIIQDCCYYPDARIHMH